MWCRVVDGFRFEGSKQRVKVRLVLAQFGRGVDRARTAFRDLDRLQQAGRLVRQQQDAVGPPERLVDAVGAEYDWLDRNLTVQ